MRKRKTMTADNSRKDETKTIEVKDDTLKRSLELVKRHFEETPPEETQKLLDELSDKFEGPTLDEYMERINGLNSVQDCAMTREELQGLIAEYETEYSNTKKIQFNCITQEEQAYTRGILDAVDGIIFKLKKYTT